MSGLHAHGAHADLLHQIESTEAGRQRRGQAHFGAGLLHHAHQVGVVADQHAVDRDIQG
jgi:hypothetical protein